jgi:hypothetical protein
MAEDCLLEAVRGLRLAHPELGPKPLLAKLREQHPDLGGGNKEVREALTALKAESEATEAAAAAPPAAAVPSAASEGGTPLPSSMHAGDAAPVGQADDTSTSTSVQHPTSAPVAAMSSAPTQTVSMTDILGEVTMQVGSYMCWASGEILDPLSMVFVLDPFCQDSALPEVWTAAAEAPYPALRLRALFGPTAHGGVFWRRPSGKMAEVSLLRRRTRDGAVAIAMNGHWVDHTAEAARYLDLGSAASVAQIAELLAEVVDDTAGRSLLTAQMQCVRWHPAVINSVFTSAGPGGVVGSIQSRGAGSTESRAVGFGHPDLEMMAFPLLFPRAQGGFREPLPEGPASGAQRAALERYASLRFRSVCSWWWSDSLYRLFMRGALMRAGADARIATEPEGATTHAVQLRYLNGPPRLQTLQEACVAGE